MRGKGQEYLEELFNSLSKQTCKDFEVIISDHSTDDKIKRLCSNWQKKFIIKYFLCNKQRGNSSVNINNAIRNASGEIIKMMHQDDFFNSERSLEIIKQKMDTNKNFFWGASGFIHTNLGKTNFFKIKIPYYNKNVIRGINTIGAPSVVFFRRPLNSQVDCFDEKLIWVSDCEFYYRLYSKYDKPLIIDDVLITIRIWHGQITNTSATKKLRAREVKYLLKKYKIKNNMNELFLKIIKKIYYYFKIKFYGHTVDFLISIIKKENPLTRLANFYRNDKGTRKLFKKEGDRHFYTEYYYTYFNKIRFNGNIRILEIGVGSGTSLKIWKRFFPYAKIYAIDINDFSKLSNDRVKCFQADQSKRKDLQNVMEQINEEIDIIIDDGGHYMNQQQISLSFLFKYLKSGGMYFIEDLHTSYWPYHGYVSVYDDIPIDTKPDRSNTTLTMIQNYLKNKKIKSEYLDKNEINYLDNNISDCILHNTTITKQGPNHLVVFIKK
jgi:glycosyltransferase involved in cell wall biosynthesis